MPLNTEFPQWLQAQYAPQAQSPWIINAIQLATEREKMRQELPLQIQQMALRNQQMQVDTQHQGLANEALSRQIQQEASDLPVYNEWFKQYGNDPKSIVDAPMPNVITPRYLQAAIDAKHAAAQTTYVQSQQMQMVNRLKQAAELNLAGADTKSAIIEGPHGPGDIDFDQTRMNELQNQVNAEKEAEKLREIQAREMHDPVIFRAERLRSLGEELRSSQRQTIEPDESNPQYWKELSKQADIQAEMAALQTQATITPQVQVVGGKEILVNPKTGHFEDLHKAPTRAQFISQNVSRWMNDFGIGEDEAAKRLGKFYDDNISSGTAAPPSPNMGQPKTASDKVVVLSPDGKKKYLLPKTQLEEAQRQGYKLSQ